MAGRAAAAAALVSCALALAGSGASAAPWSRDLALASRGLDRAVARGRLTPDEAATYRAVLGRAAHALPRLPSSRYENLAAVVHQVAGFWKGYDEARALTLFSMLDFNVSWFSRHWDQRPGTDAVGPDGVWYRAFPGIGFQFHPLEEFGKLNGLVSAGNAAAAQLLAQELLDRGVPRYGGLAWEYYFRFEGGAPPWVSGMAQAVAAQALARAGTLLRAPDVVAAARRAEATVPNLLLRVGGSPWVRIYAFNRETVLNAQLQTIVSLQDYAAATGDPAAQSLVSALISATTRLLPRFDTGYWSLYSLGGPEAPLEYHQYVVALLRILASRTRQPVLTTYAGRFRADLTQPPLVKGGAGPPPLYPWPADGFRDVARLVFWVSKRSTVTLNVAGAARATLLVPRAGWRVIVWRPRGIGTGTFATSLHAVDVAGNASDTDLPPLQIRRDTEPPTVDAALAGTRLSWTATDDATPWLRLTLSFNRLRAHRRLSLGRRRLRGSLRVSPPRGTWSVILIAADSSGNATRVPLGLTRGRGG